MAMVGRISGSLMYQKTQKWLAPSITAASVRSSGMFSSAA